jgi:hypothetical protein
MEIFERIVSLVKENNEKADDKFVKFSDPKYESFPLDKCNFRKIEERESKNRVVFIDAGSAEIISSANFSLSLMRTYYSVYESGKRAKSGKKDFYAFTKSKNKDGELFYDTEIMGAENLQKEDLLLNSFDETIKQGISRAKISNVVNVIRRFSELAAATELIDILEENDIIVLDGSLQCTFTNERKYLDGLYKKAKGKKVIITGLSKTTTLMTDKGNSVNNALSSFNTEGKWIYHPVADINSEEHKSEMAFVKLHDKSKHIFRFEIYKEQKDKLEDAAAILAENCKDPVFLGYPYGLIEADRSARISNNEKNMLMTFLSVKFGKDWERISDALTSVDAHSVLDRIS